MTQGDSSLLSWEEDGLDTGRQKITHTVTCERPITPALMWSVLTCSDEGVTGGALGEDPVNNDVLVHQQFLDKLELRETQQLH